MRLNLANPGLIVPTQLESPPIIVMIDMEIGGSILLNGWPELPDLVDRIGLPQ
jgi:nitrogen fixation protein